MNGYCERFELRIAFNDGRIGIDTDEAVAAWQLWGVLEAAKLEISHDEEEDRILGPHRDMEVD